MYRAPKGQLLLMRLTMRKETGQRDHDHDSTTMGRSASWDAQRRGARSCALRAFGRDSERPELSSIGMSSEPGGYLDALLRANPA